MFLIIKDGSKGDLNDLEKITYTLKVIKILFLIIKFNIKTITINAHHDWKYNPIIQRC